MHDMRVFFEKFSQIIKRSVVVAVTIPLALGMGACSFSNNADKKPSYYKYLGEYAYDASISALVVEPMQGEDTSGVQYRTVDDLNGIVTQTDVPVCLYFYTSLAQNDYGITAGVENLAEYYDGECLFVSIDGVDEKDITSAYGIEALPDFVLIIDGARISTFDGLNYSSDGWTMDDVNEWLSTNGIGG